MRYIEYRSIRGALAAVLGALVLAGGASDPRYSQGVEWVTAQEAERKRLEAAGFPQYTGAP
jgi:outer membrane murein-binding lipoprotein Lpp